MARVFPVTAIKFSCYDQIKALTMPKGEEHYSGAEGFLRKAPTPHCTPPGEGLHPDLFRVDGFCAFAPGAESRMLYGRVSGNVGGVDLWALTMCCLCDSRRLVPRRRWWLIFSRFR